jgi:hypothetical protein
MARRESLVCRGVMNKKIPQSVGDVDVLLLELSAKGCLP